MAAPAALSWVGGAAEYLAYVRSIDNAGACMACFFARTCWTVKVFFPLMSAMDTVFLPVTSTGDATAELMSDATRAKFRLKCILGVWYRHGREKGLFARIRGVLGRRPWRPDGQMLYTTLERYEYFYPVSG
jgi:hypothetical protein